MISILLRVIVLFLTEEKILNAELASLIYLVLFLKNIYMQKVRKLAEILLSSTSILAKLVEKETYGMAEEQFL